MRIYNNPKELINSEVPFNIRSYLYPIFERGMIAYSQLLESNSKTFSDSFFPNIKGWLVNYLIFRQFEPDMTSVDFPFAFDPIEVNHFKYKALLLRRDNVIINVGKAYNDDSLPSKSKYRKALCRLNNFSEKGLFCDTDANNNLTIRNEPYFMFLTYGYKRSKLDFVNLIVPNKEMTGYLDKIPLKPEQSLLGTGVTDPVETEKRITSLKEDALKKLTILKGEAK